MLGECGSRKAEDENGEGHVRAETEDDKQRNAVTAGAELLLDD